MTAPRPTPIEVLSILRLDGSTSARAFVDVRLGGVTIKGAKIVQQDGQWRWLAMPGSSAPASEVASPSSNAASTRRPSTGANPNRSRLHCVGIGELLCASLSLCVTEELWPAQSPDAPTPCEKSGLERCADELICNRGSIEVLE
jgi:hypothetical protein